jgi:hypothetical protein
MTYARQSRKLIFTSRIYVHQMMPAAVPTLSHTLSSRLRLVCRFIGSFLDFPSRFLQGWLGAFRSFGYLVPRTLLAGSLIGGVTVTTTKPTEQKNRSEDQWKLYGFLFSHAVS